MSSPAPLDPLRLFLRVAPERYIRELCRQHGYGVREEIYSARVVIWLMIWQRLRGNVGMAAAVQYLLQNEAAELQGDCRRWAADRVSAATGGYSQARTNYQRL